MPEKSQIAAIILAAGSSRRFGSNKLRHPLTLGGVTKPLIELSLLPWLEVFGQITVVVSKDSDRPLRGLFDLLDSRLRGNDGANGLSRLNPDSLLEPNEFLPPYRGKVRMGVESLNSCISTPTLALLRVPGQKLNGLQGGGNKEPNERSGLTTCTINWVVCENSADGISASLACGVRANINASGWVIGLADMPKVPSAAIAGVRDALLEGASLAAPFCNGKRGHPVGFASPYKEDLLLLKGDTGARHLLERDKANLARIKTNDHGIFFDVDTLSDLQNISL